MHASTETFTIAVLYLFFYNIQQVLGKGICALASIALFSNITSIKVKTHHYELIT